MQVRLNLNCLFLLEGGRVFLNVCGSSLRVNSHGSLRGIYRRWCDELRVLRATDRSFILGIQGICLGLDAGIEALLCFGNVLVKDVTLVGRSLGRDACRRLAVNGADWVVGHDVALLAFLHLLSDTEVGFSILREQVVLIARGHLLLRLSIRVSRCVDARNLDLDIRVI